MATPTFFQWLQQQDAPRNPHRRVARFAMKCGCWPVRAKSFLHVLDHVNVQHKPLSTHPVPSEAKLRAAYEAYHEFLAAGGALKKSVQRKDQEHRGFLIPRETVRQIRELSKIEDATQGTVLERAVGSRYRKVVARATA